MPFWVCDENFSLLITSPKWHLQITSFCSTNSLKPKDSSLAIINDKEKQKMMTLKKLEPAKVCDFCFKIDRNDYSIVRIVGN